MTVKLHTLPSKLLKKVVIEIKLELTQKSSRESLKTVGKKSTRVQKERIIVVNRINLRNKP